MNRYKLIAIVLFVFTFGAIQETGRIFLSDPDDVGNEKMELTIMGGTITIIAFVLAVVFWRKAEKAKKTN